MIRVAHCSTCTCHSRKPDFGLEYSRGRGEGFSVGTSGELTAEDYRRIQPALEGKVRMSEGSNED